MVELKQKQILIDGKPQLILSGEIHYYRVPKNEWGQRLDQLKAMGFNAVASYIPWLCHQEVEDELDLDGHLLPELDLASFIDLCAQKNLYFIARPGPFIMAEMKNEGIPYWVMKKHPEVIPTTWDGQPVSTATLDYLAPAFLNEVKLWYRAVAAIIEPRLQPKGGNVIAWQLDNEVGMLSWVSNSPDLTPLVLNGFNSFLKQQYGAKVDKRYPFFDREFAPNIVSPQEKYALAIHQDLGHYMRHRFTQYIDHLREIAENYGIHQIPFIVNIHGTSGGRALLYPIGISQLMETYQKPGYLSGSDIYFGDLTMNNFQDLYIINNWMDSVNPSDQPLTSMEFNCGDGNFGDNLGERYDPSASDFKARMCVAQGNRLINYYLLSGGFNYRLRHRPHDGNDRIAITGEAHGFAAPMGPSGIENYTVPRLTITNRVMRANAPYLSQMREEKDSLFHGFIPDYFMTESSYPKSQKMRQLVDNLQANRIGAAWEIIAKYALLRGYRFGGVNLQDSALNVVTHPTLFLSSARYMAPHIQQRLAEYVHQGGKLWLTGELPIYDMEGEPCTIFATSIGVTVGETIYDRHRFELSIVPVGPLQGHPEIRAWYAQTYTGADLTPLYKVYFNQAVCGFEANVGRGQIRVMGSPLNANLDLLDFLFQSWKLKPRLSHDFKDHGVFMTSTHLGEARYIHLLNLDGFDKHGHLYLDGQPLWADRILTLGRKEGILLPFNVTFFNIKVVDSTAEIIEVKQNQLGFRLTQPEDCIHLQTARKLKVSNAKKVIQKGDNYWIYTTQDYHRSGEFFISFD